jgi:hypothetical protein
MEPPTPYTRDRALRRLRGLTIGVAGSALAAVAVFAGIAAATIPGHAGTAAQASSTTSSASSSGSTSRADTSSSSLQTTTAPQSSSSSSSSHAATGGS